LHPLNPPLQSLPPQSPQSLHGGIEPEDVIYDQTNQVTSLLQVVMVTNDDI